jgi:hypothetical protein
MAAAPHPDVSSNYLKVGDFAHAVPTISTNRRTGFLSAIAKTIAKTSDTATD